ncbi:MAG: hypothetical protein VZQ84_01725 [Anaerovoracaceae bacterium]|nr:hypothetical protein [Anaerovoracaceae bacterium]
MYSRKIIAVIAAYMVAVIAAFAIGYAMRSYIVPLVIGAAALTYMIYTIVSYFSDKKAGRSTYGYVKVIGYQCAVVVMFALMTYSFSLN